MLYTYMYIYNTRGSLAGCSPEARRRATARSFIQKKTSFLFKKQGFVYTIPFYDEQFYLKREHHCYSKTRFCLYNTFL